MTRCLVLMLLLAPVLGAAAEPVRLLVAVANAEGADGEEPLRYAAADAEHFRSLMIEIGQVTADRAYLVIDKSAAEVQRTLAEVGGRLTELKAAGRDATLILYFSLHAKDHALHLRGTELPIAWVREFAEQVDARVAIVILDACESGALARQKGGSRVPEYAIDLKAQPMSGRVFLSASGPMEPAQEWDSLGGSLFTHHLLSGLRGDADTSGNGAVSLAEAYTYAYQRTVADARGTGQHPVLDVDLTGTGEVSLTQPGGSRTRLEFGSGTSGHYLVVSQPRPDVVVEVDKREGERQRIAVPPGRYLIRKRLNDGAVGLYTVELPFGGIAAITDSVLSRQTLAEARMKGGTIELLQRAVLVSAEYDTEQLLGSSGRLVVGAALRQTFGSWWGSVGVALGLATFRGQALTVDELRGRATLLVGHRWLWSPVSFYLAGLGRVTVLRQATTRDDEARILTFAPPMAPTWSVGVDVGVSGLVELSLSNRVFLFGLLEPLVRYLPSTLQSPWSVGLSGGAGVGFRL